MNARSKVALSLVLLAGVAGGASANAADTQSNVQLAQATPHADGGRSVEKSRKNEKQFEIFWKGFTKESGG